MPFFLSRVLGAKPTDPAVVVNENGEPLADADGAPIKVDIPEGVAPAAVAEAVTQAVAQVKTVRDADAESEVLASLPESFRSRYEQLKSQAETAAREKAQLEAQSRAEKWKAEASVFLGCDQARKVLTPAGREKALPAYLSAAADDHASPRAEGRPSRVDEFKAFVQSIPAHSYTGETLASGKVDAEAAARAIAEMGGQASVVANDWGSPAPADSGVPAASSQDELWAIMAKTTDGVELIRRKPGGPEWLARNRIGGVASFGRK